MKFLFDFFPVILFFIAYKTSDIYVATVVAIVAGIAQVGYTWLKNRRIENAHIITLVLLVVMGGATLYLQDETFIKWKPTVVNWLFAVAFLGSQFIGKKPIIQRMLGTTVSLPESIWLRLNMSWVVFFAVLGAANLYVVYTFDTDTWVNFKLFGMLALTFGFVLIQGFFIARHIKPEADEPPRNGS